MESRKNKNKATFAAEQVAGLLQEVINRWHSKSPKTARIATDALFWTGVAASVLPIIPINIPAWVISASLITGSILTKLTTEKNGKGNSN